MTEHQAPDPTIILDCYDPRDLATRVVLSLVVEELARLSGVKPHRYFAKFLERCVHDIEKATLETADGSEPEDVRTHTMIELAALLGVPSTL